MPPRTHWLTARRAMAVGCGLTAFGWTVVPSKAATATMPASRRCFTRLAPICPRFRGARASRNSARGPPRNTGWLMQARAGELAFKGGGKDSHHRIGTLPEFRDLPLGMAASRGEGRSTTLTHPGTAGNPAPPPASPQRAQLAPGSRAGALGCE